MEALGIDFAFSFSINVKKIDKCLLNNAPPYNTTYKHVWAESPIPTSDAYLPSYFGSKVDTQQASFIVSTLYMEKTCKTPIEVTGHIADGICRYS